MAWHVQGIGKKCRFDEKHYYAKLCPSSRKISQGNSIIEPTVDCASTLVNCKRLRGSRVDVSGNEGREEVDEPSQVSTKD